MDQNTTITLGGIQKEQTVLVVPVESATDVFTRAIRAIEMNTPFVSAGAGETEGIIRIRDTQTESPSLMGRVWSPRDDRTFSLTGWKSVVSAKVNALAYHMSSYPVMADTEEGSQQEWPIPQC